MRTTALERAIKAAGSLTELARRLEVDPQVIVNWRKRGIPARWVLEVESATIDRDKRGRPIAGSKPAVTRHELHPKLYPQERAA